MPTKVSYGVILCRHNLATRRPEAVVVRRRYTYSYAEFVYNAYLRGHVPPGVALRVAAPLFDRMTSEELLDIWSLQFSQIWYRISLSQGDRGHYDRNAAMFAARFLGDGGVALRAALQAARGGGGGVWVFPRGRREGGEAPLACAVRELAEETGITKADYRLLPGVRRVDDYVSRGTRYTITYFIAVAVPRYDVPGQACGDRQPPLRALGDAGGHLLRDARHMGEIGEIRWLDIAGIRLLSGGDARLEHLAAPAFRLARAYRSGRWGHRRDAQKCDFSRVPSP